MDRDMGCLLSNLFFGPFVSLHPDGVFQFMMELLFQPSVIFFSSSHFKFVAFTDTLSNQSTINSNTKRHIEVGEMSIEILTRNESVKYLGQRISFHQQETLEIKSTIRAAWASFHKYSQELTSKKYMLKHLLRLFDAAVSPTLCYAAGTWTPNKRTRKNDSIDATQDATTHYPDQKKIQKIEKQDIEPKEEKCIVDITEICSTDDESDDGQSTKFKDDVDSEVTY